jgi:hypothetical protein
MTMRKVLLACGIASSLLYLAMNIFVPMLYQGYSSVTQTISELSAIGAPTRPLWVALAVLYTVLVAAGGWGVWMSAGSSRPLRVAGWLMIAYGVLGIFWPPMHQREVLAAGGGTLTDIMHIAFTGTVILMMVAIGYASAALGKRFRIYSIVTLVLMVIAGVLVGMEAPGLHTGQPTPLIGVWERLNIAVYMLWIVVFALALWREPEAQPRSVTGHGMLVAVGR